MRSLWERASSPGVVFPRLAGHNRSDVAVIGAGIAGLSTALHLAEQGLDVTVIEADQPGSGATGQSGGLIAPNFVHHQPSGVLEKFGDDAGTRLINLIGNSARDCFDLVERHGIDCGARISGFWCPGHTAALVEEQKNQADEWRSLGFNACFAGEDETQRTLSTPRYRSAITFADGGELNPLAYACGLAKTAASFGAGLFVDSPVRKISRQADGGWRVQTDHGTLDARRVVLAANGGNAALHPAMARTVLPLRVFEFATEPLPEEVRARLLPDGGAFTDKQPYVFTARYDPDGRLVSAFPYIMFKRQPKSLLAEARRRLLRHFPAIGSPKIDCLWEGTAWLNTSLLPKIYEVDDSMYAIQACNGRGLAVNTSLGREMAIALGHNDMSGLPVELERPKRIGAYAFASKVPTVFTALGFLLSRIRHGN